MERLKNYKMCGKILIMTCILMSSIIFLSCNHNKPVGQFKCQVKFDSLLNHYNSSVKDTFLVDFEEIFDSVEWDLIAVVGPYMTQRQLNNLNYCASDQVIGEMKKVASVDWQYGLFFVKNECFVSYTILKANPGFKYPRTGASLIRRNDAKLNLVKFRSSNGRLGYYFILKN